jgi:hypothetical protein
MPAIQVRLPTLYPGQVAAMHTPRCPHLAIRCGRRWGKTDLLKTIACDGATRGQSIGWFTPDYKIQTEAFREVATILAPIKLSSSRIDGLYRTTSGGRIDFWTLENERAGRSRKYHKVLIDEAAFTKPNMMHIWETAIFPSLVDYNGYAIAASTPNGNSVDNFFFQVCSNKALGFGEYHAKTFDNPFVPIRLTDEPEIAYLERKNALFEKLRQDNHPLVYQQEFLADFVDWSGAAFFSRESLLVNGQAVPFPTKCDAVFAVMDTAVKDGKKHDGSAVTFYATHKWGSKHKLTILDWDIIQVEGSFLETWLPTVFSRLDELGKMVGARAGSLGVHIEDKASGSILIQQARRRGWKAFEIDSALTASGKDERAISISGYVFRGEVKMSAFAHDKVTTYKGTHRNHFYGQVCGFHVGVPDQQDDLLDTFCYGVSMALGNSQGF